MLSSYLRKAALYRKDYYIIDPMDLLKALERLKTWHFFAIAVLFSEILTLLLNSVQSIARWGRISSELLEIGAIDAVVVSLIVAFIIVSLLRYSAKMVLEKKILQKEITERKQAEERLQKAYDELDIRIQERTADLAETNELLLADIAERKRTEEELQHYSERDHLTMIYNRRKFFELLETEISKAKRYARPLTLIMLDIDHFKKVNDKYGHNIGDLVLKTTANIAGDIIRKVDILARYGGDEFMILSPETDIEEAVVMVERIRVAVETHSYTAGVKITISAGVAEWSGEESQLAFIKIADDMLYVAKNMGRNRVEAAERRPRQGNAD